MNRKNSSINVISLASSIVNLWKLRMWLL
jgi:hypothetical protein